MTCPTKFPEIWAALAAEFEPWQVRERKGGGGSMLSYITARTAMNRLDDVFGPENWWDHYEETKDGLKCVLTVRLPDGSTVTKEDGGGFANMPEEDNAEKSGYSDAFKRVAVKFGVARYLYKDSVPRFIWEMQQGKAPKGTPGKPGPGATTPDNRSYAEFAAAAAAKCLIQSMQLHGHVLDKAIEAGYLNSGLRDSDAIVSDLSEIYMHRRDWVRGVVQAFVKSRVAQPSAA